MEQINIKLSAQKQEVKNPLVKQWRKKEQSETNTKKRWVKEKNAKEKSENIYSSYSNPKD